MGQLSSTAYYSRQIIKIGSIVLVALIFVQITVMYLYNTFIKNRSQKPPPPQVAYGQLPPLDFPVSDPNINFNFRLETISGRLPTDFPDRAEVYINVLTKPNLLDYSRAQKVAQKLGFPDSGIPFDPPMYRWLSQGQVAGILEYDTLRNTFDMVYDWERNERVYVSPNKSTITDNSVFNAARGFLNKSGIWQSPWSAKDAQFAILYYRYINGQIVKVDHESKADFFQVNFQRSPLNGLEFVSADPYRPVVWALVSRNGLQVAELHYNYYPIDEASHTDYPLEPIETAWQEVRDNKAYIATMGDNLPGNEVIIRHFQLAYFLSNKFQKFTQPVYVIKGDGGFTSYVPAIDRQLIRSTQ